MATGDISQFYGRYLGDLTDRPSYEDLLGDRNVLGTDSDVLDMMHGTGDQYAPGGMDIDLTPARMSPQDFIRGQLDRQQLAGDVVPMRRMGSPGAEEVLDRFQQPGVYMGSRGAAAIGQAGGRSSPYLDLLRVLSYPGGGSMAPPIGRR